MTPNVNAVLVVALAQFNVLGAKLCRYYFTVGTKNLNSKAKKDGRRFKISRFYDCLWGT
jgi:hypothetical protein